MLRARSPGGSRVWESLYSQHDSLFADKVMTEADWQRRRKATHRHRLQPVTLARVMLGYFPLLLWVAVLSVAVGVYDITLVKYHNWPMLSVSSVQTFFSAITFALTLLLVFKTNSSYSRWWEARKDVGQLVSLVHDLVRQAVAFFPPHQAHLMHAMARWSAAAMWVDKALVRQGAPLREELQNVLTPEELTWLMAAPHRQLALSQALSSIVAQADIDPMTRFSLNEMLTRHTFTFGAFGRIFNTAIPSAYTRHTSRFLMCYILIGLPLLLWPLAGWSSPVLGVLISFLLLGVENIGSFIEEPFHVIAFDKFCAAIQRDVNNILAMHDNSQCSVCAQHRGGWGSTGGLVPMVQDLTTAPPPASPLASAAAAGPRVSLGSNAASRVSMGSNAGGGGQSHQRVLSGVGPVLPAAAATIGTVEAAAAAPQSRSSLHLQVDALGRQQELQQQFQAQAAAAAAQVQLQPPLHGPEGAVAGVRSSDSKTCLLSEAHSHSHRE